MKVKTKIHGIDAILDYPATKSTWFPCKGDTAAVPESNADLVLLRLRFRDAEEGDGYVFMIARWGHNFNERWFVQEASTKCLYASSGCGEIWNFLPEHYEHNLDAWKFL